MPWPKRKSAASEALLEWVMDYKDLLNEGYRPEGFDYIPIPYAARIYDRGTLKAEWYSRLSPVFSAESPVTADERTGSGGIPTDVPSTSCSGVSAAEGPPNGAKPLREPAVNNADRLTCGLEPGQPVA